MTVRSPDEFETDVGLAFEALIGRELWRLVELAVKQHPEWMTGLIAQYRWAYGAAHSRSASGGAGKVAHGPSEPVPEVVEDERKEILRQMLDELSSDIVSFRADLLGSRHAAFKKLMGDVAPQPSWTKLGALISKERFEEQIEAQRRRRVRFEHYGEDGVVTRSSERAKQ